jgi:hypothetical protein
MLGPISFDFHISQTISKNAYEKALREVSDFPISNASTKYENNFLKNNKDLNDELPEDFPTITVNVKNEPSNGYLFIAPYQVIPRSGYLTIIDNNAIPIYYVRKPNSSQTDFKVQQNGLLTWGDLFTRYFYTMDSSYTVIDSLSTGNGYETDVHDLQMMSNGHWLLLAYDPQPVRMDTIVPGGDPSAIVIGLIVQELDVNKNVVFQWRSWDHFQITDATEDINLTQHTIDYVHGNAIELDYDGNILISSRHLDEITKINKQTGEIIWRWGGLKSKNSQFMFVNDPITFSHQHDIRRLPNGNVTLFDNGNLHNQTISRAREYILDESGMTAELVWAHSLEPPSFIVASGNVQTLPENNKIIGWGGWFAQGDEAISEVHNDGSVALEILLDEEFGNYRAFKFPWRTNLFVTNPDSIFFESVSVGDSAIISVDLINNSANPVDITGYYNVNKYYVVENPVPFTLPAFGTVPLSIKFVPSEDGYFKDYLHIRSDTETSRITQVMILAGRTDTIFSNVKEDEVISDYVLGQNYPNPFNPSTTIGYSISTQSNVRLSVYNSIGENIAELINANQNAGSYEINWDAGNFASGIYLYSIEAIPADGSEYFRSVRKMILLK